MTGEGGTDTSDETVSEPEGDEAAHSNEAAEPPESDAGAEEGAEDPELGEDEPQQDAAPAEDGEDEPPEEEGEPEPEKPADSPPPSGHASWEAAARAADEQARHLRQRLEQLTPFVQQALTRPPEPKSKPSSWVPHGDDPIVRRALTDLRSNPEKFKTLPGEIQARAAQAQGFMDEKWGDYMLDPGKLVEEHVLPKLDGSAFAARLLQLEEAFYRSAGEAELSKHSNAMSPQDRQELVTLTAQGIPLSFAVQHLQMKQQLAALSGSAPKKTEQKKSEAQAREKQRAAQGTKRGQRPGKPPAALYGTTDPVELHRRMKKDGRIT